MSQPSLADLVQELSQGPLLSVERRQELAGLQASCADARALARELLQRNWLTPYQVNQLLQGRGRDLVLGPYVLQERLGEGGMGQVFKAHHTFLNRPVALKLIGQEHLGNAAAVERFRLEMQLVAQLDHPHIVRALDAGTAGARFYLAMELIEGVTLTRQVQQHGPLSVARACACIRQAALGLQHASERGLVHRDIKPSNLMLSTPKVGEPAIKVLDLGLARPQGNDSSRDLTRTGTVTGTLDYLAPEQALDPRGVDVRADIYSLGCTFFFLLTGRPPFHGGTEAQRLLQHQQQAPPSVEALRADVPPALAAVLLRLLAKRPEQRFATAGEVAEVLRPFASWADWENGPPTTTIAPCAAGPANSLVDPPPLSGERGWTLLTDPTRAGVVPPTAVVTAGPTPTTAGPGFSIVLPDATQSASPAAPSLVSKPAAVPEKGWTLLAEPEPRSAAVPVAILAGQPANTPVLATPAPRPGLKALRRSPWLLAAVGAAALLLLVGVVLLVRSLAGPSSAGIVAVQALGKDGQKPPPVVQIGVSKEPPLAKAPFGAARAKELQEAWAKYLGRKVVKSVDLGGGVTMEFVLFPPGTFRMGTPDAEIDQILRENEIAKREWLDDQRPQREVTITKPFYLGKYEVTQEQYARLAGVKPSWFQAGGGGKDKVTALDDTRRFPVEQVSWDMATAYCKELAPHCKRLGLKADLPSEAEWEYACRAGTETPFHFGGRLNGAEANCCGLYPYGTTEKGPFWGRTCLVGQYPANAWGLHGMHGNVWEWCRDYYGRYDDLEAKDPLGTKKRAEEFRVLRGGAWSYRAWFCRAANRRWIAPGYRGFDIGFRVALRLD